MNAVSANPFLGILLHGVGAFFAATCYTPEQTVVGGIYRDGRMHSLRVTPETRRADVTVVKK